MFGVVQAPVECFAPLIVGDIAFTSQRARLHSMYFIVLLLSTNVGGAISGAFADSRRCLLYGRPGDATMLIASLQLLLGEASTT